MLWAVIVSRPAALNLIPAPPFPMLMSVFPSKVVRASVMNATNVQLFSLNRVDKDKRSAPIYSLSCF